MKYKIEYNMKNFSGNLRLWELQLSKNKKMT